MGVLGFGVAVTESEGGAVVSVAGELDVATAPQLQSALAVLVERAVRSVVVDLAEVSFIDSTGLSVLVSGLKRFGALGGELTLRSPSRGALRLLEITGLTPLFAIS